MSRQELPRKLRIADAAAIVVGTVIGSAIFLVPAAVAQSLPSAGSILFVWAVTGVLSFFGALAYAELGAMLPHTGGQYIYLREAFGSLWAFLCGWSFLLVIQSGGIATLAVGFSIYLSYFIPLTPLLSKAAAVGLILILTFINYRGVEAGASVQRMFTALKISGLAILIASAFMSTQPSALEWSFVPAGFNWSQFGIAMIACLWAYEGWNVISFVAGEVKEPQRNLPLALGVGVAVIVVIYMMANLAFMHVLPIAEIATTERVAATVAERTIGPLGGTIVSLTILLSIIGSTNGSIMTSPRVYFALSRDGLFFRKVGEVQTRFKTPGAAILLQGAWAAILAASGSYETLFSYVIFAAWIFYGMTVAGVLILRKTHPNVPRPYKMWGYPLTPLLFAGISGWFVVNTLITTPKPSIVGILIVASGIPVYFAGRRGFASQPVQLEEKP